MKTIIFRTKYNNGFPRQTSEMIVDGHKAKQCFSFVLNDFRLMVENFTCLSVEQIFFSK